MGLDLVKGVVSFNSTLVASYLSLSPPISLPEMCIVCVQEFCCPSTSERRGGYSFANCVGIDSDMAPIIGQRCQTFNPVVRCSSPGAKVTCGLGMGIVAPFTTTMPFSSCITCVFCYHLLLGAKIHSLQLEIYACLLDSLLFCVFVRRFATTCPLACLSLQSAR